MKTFKINESIFPINEKKNTLKILQLSINCLKQFKMSCWSMENNLEIISRYNLEILKKKITADATAMIEKDAF